MSRSKSSSKWLKEHFADTYVKRAQQDGLRARSAYKLIEINEQYKILNPGMVVVDLGAAPGSWSEYAAKIIGGKNPNIKSAGKVFALDILPINPINSEKNVTYLQGDFTKPEVLEQLSQLTGTANCVDVVLSDMAPNTSGIREIDQARSFELVLAAFNFSRQTLKKNGTFLVKAFQSQDFANLIKELRDYFRTVKILKPQASRARSQEVFLLAQGFVLQ